MSTPGSRHVVIIGGGASGVLAAAHLLRQPGPGFRVSIVEPGPELGAGIAYATRSPSHLLNTRVGDMGAIAGEPDGFRDWLAGRLGPEAADATVFASRRAYGDYLAGVLSPWMAGSGDGRLRHVRDTATGLVETETGVRVTLAQGTILVGHAAVLATGHRLPTYPAEGLLSDPWAVPAPAGAVMILGTGLTMIDHVLTLRDQGHPGPVLALSRRGLMPRAHLAGRTLRLDPADIPFGTDIGYLMRWLRRTIGQHRAQGGDWRDVIDGLRPHAQSVWTNLAADDRSRFLRHARVWWDVHRHRMAPPVAERVAEAMAEGWLTVRAGRVTGLRRDTAGLRVVWAPRGSAARPVVAHVARVVDCTGVTRPLEATACALIATLRDRGLVRPCPLGLGIDADRDGRLIGSSGAASRRLFALGPLTRAAFWEVVAVPDIRVQAEALARRLADRIGDAASDGFRRSGTEAACRGPG